MHNELKDALLIRFAQVPDGRKFLAYVNLNRTETAIFKGMPIGMLNEFRDWLGPLRGAVKVRYRGPRKHRPRHQGQTHCLKRDAVVFSVYREYS